MFAGHPLFRRDEIKRILVVKLDHIGDFITALPAIRRLKQHFPTATIHVLAARGARSFAETLRPASTALSSSSSSTPFWPRQRRTSHRRGL